VRSLGLNWIGHGKETVLGQIQTSKLDTGLLTPWIESEILAIGDKARANETADSGATIFLLLILFTIEISSLAIKPI